MFRRLCTIWRLSKLTLAAAILWGGAVPASAQSLRQALISTYENSPTIRTAQAQALQSVEVYNQAVAATKLQVNGSLSNTIDSNTLTNPDGVTSAQIQFSQDLFRGSFDGIASGLRQALAGVSSAQAGYKTQEMGTFSQVVNAYMGVLRDEGALGVAASGVATAEQELEAANARLNAGEGTRTDVALAEAGLAQAQSGLALARSAVETAKASYQQLVGSAAQGLQDPGFPNLPASQAAAIALAMEQHPGIQAAEIGVQAAEDAVVTTRAQHGLSLALTGSVSQAWDSSWNDFGGQNHSVQITGSIPLFDGGTRKAAIQSAEQGLEIALASLADQKAAVRAQVRAAWAGAQAQISNLNSLITVTTAQEIVLEATKAEFDAGTATFLQVQNAQQNFAEAQNAYVQAKSNAVIAAYNVLSAIGGMTTETLGLPVDHFDVLVVLDDSGNRTYIDMLLGR